MYLIPYTNRPTWAKITDIVIDAAAPKNNRPPDENEHFHTDMETERERHKNCDTKQKHNQND